jgi:hypothetical protein
MVGVAPWSNKPAVVAMRKSVPLIIALAASASLQFSRGFPFPVTCRTVKFRRAFS